VAVYFFDSSALVKRYVQETGTAWVRRLTRKDAANHIYLARITVVEVTAAIARRRKGGTLLPPRASSLLSRFRTHLSGRYTVVEITPALLADAARLANAHALRAYDAVQLAAALTLNAQVTAIGLGSIVLGCADLDLNKAAQAEGLLVEDPNSYP
jgi:predicted nucleic acid-binding protein